MGNTIIVGAGLTGSILAIKIAKKYKNENVYLIDNSKNILSSFKPVNFNGIKVNNGFHALEIDRARELFYFLKNEIKIKFKKIITKRSLLINEYYINNLSYNNFPLELKKDLKKKRFNSKSINSLYKLLIGQYKKTIEIVSKRYFDKTSKSLRFFIPWFLPKEFNYISQDEGDKFRVFSKKKKINYLATPKENNLFFNISKKIEKKLRSYNNIIILKNSNIEIEKNNIFIVGHNIKKKISTNQIFITTMPTFFFKFFNKKEKNYIKKLVENKKYFVLSIIKLRKSLNTYFSEILCATKDFIELSRISKVNFSNSSKDLLLELLFNEKKINNEKFKKKVSKSIKPIIKNNKILSIKKKISRTIFMPNNSDIDNCLKIINKKVHYFRKKGLNISFNPYFGPINMSKTWILSKKFYEKADKNLSR